MKIEIVDNFLKSRDFKRISNLSLKKINKTNLKVYHNSVVGKKSHEDES